MSCKESFKEEDADNSGFLDMKEFQVRCSWVCG